MSRRRRNCDGRCDCNCEPIVAVTAAVTATGITTLTINQSLASLTYFELCIPCSLLTDTTDSTVVFTDGTLTYDGFNCLASSLRTSMLKRQCGCSPSCLCNQVVVRAFAGTDTVGHVTILTKLC